jgi:transcriptional repressor NrdR
MVCVHCRSDTQVINSRLQKKANQVWRRRKCGTCGAIFSSREVAQYELVWLVRSNKALQPFNRDKLLLSIYASCQHRPSALADASALTETVMNKLLFTAANGILEAPAIVQIIQVALNRFDKAASVHYQAFHRP